MKLYLFDNSLRLRKLLGLPAMTGKERKIYKKILLSFDSSQPIDVFEYGSGYSTIYFAKFLRQQGRQFSFHAIDNNREWYLRVKELVKKNKLEGKVKLYLYEFPPFYTKQGWEWGKTPEVGKFAPTLPSENDYVNTPLKLGMKFDLIVIDARFRRRCIEVAKQCLKPNGIVFLHDAERKHYHPSVNDYHISEFINSGQFYPFEKNVHKIWLGSENSPLIKEIVNEIKGKEPVSK